MTTGIGIDVSKDKVDVAYSDRPRTAVFEQSDAGHAALVASLRETDVHRIVVEASGGYELALLVALEAAGLPVVLIQPSRARNYAKASKKHAKTDAIDARVLAEMAVSVVKDDPLWTSRTEDERALRSLVHRRQQLVEMREAERKRLRGAVGAAVESIRRSVAFLTEEVRRVERERTSLLKHAKELGERVAALDQVHGVGTVTATVLVTEMPELGTLDRGAAAALVGVAPMNRESGRWNGPRRIQGGRSRVRKALYMAAVAASRSNPTIRAFYLRLRETKKPKVALAACMRKLIIHLNSLMRAHLATRLAA